MGLVFRRTLNILTIFSCKPYFCLRILLASSDSESLAFLISPSSLWVSTSVTWSYSYLWVFLCTFYLSRIPISSYRYLSIIYNKPYGGLYCLTVFSISLKVNVLLIRELCYLGIIIAAHSRRSSIIPIL